MVGTAARVTIPVRNVYYLLCYAWKRLEQGQMAEVEELESTDLVHLFARVLRKGMDDLVRRGLAREYLTREEATGRLRGKIDFARTSQHMLLRQARVWCVFDELTHDIVHNQILKATARRLVALDDLDADLSEGLRAHVRRLHEVEDVDIRNGDFHRVRLHRNTACYGHLLSVCRFLHENLLPEDGGRSRPFRDFLRDERKMARLFEEFVLEFYRTEQRHFSVKAESFEWFGLTGPVQSTAMIPRLITDIVLRDDERVIVIDTKYYARALTEHYGKTMVRPGHMNQLFAYVANITRREDRDPGSVAGLLLYPTVEQELDIEVTMHGHRMCMHTVDLSRPWAEIHDRLLMLVGAAGGRMASAGVAG